MRGSVMICQPQKLSFLLSIPFIVACVLTPTTIASLEGLTLNFIHRDLIYPSKNTHGSDVISKAKSTNQTSYHAKQVSKLKSIGTIFLVEYYIGTPGIRQLGIFDTGSFFPLVKCAASSPRHGNLTFVYNELASSSYVNSSCKGRAAFEYCGKVPGHACDDKERCEYDMPFLDGTRSKGHIGFETISFSDGRHTNRSAIVEDVLFGCETDNYNIHPDEHGLFGIGGLLPLAIVQKTQRRFSFCFCNISDPSYMHNHLALGSDARLEGISVPYRGEGYGVFFSSINVGSKRLPLYNFIVDIDSGSTMSYFEPRIYNSIRSIVRETIGTHMRQKNSSYFPGGLCYESTSIWRAFPHVTIQSGRAYLLLMDIEGLFIRTYDNAFCLAIKPQFAGLPNLLGAVQMQYHNVGFDLRSQRVYFQRKVNCDR